MALDAPPVGQLMGGDGQGGPNLAERQTLLRQHGDFALAYSATYQPGLRHFGDEQGFLAYATVGRSALVMSNPIAPRDLWDDLIRRFVAEMGDVSFWQVSRPVAEHLSALGFRVNEIGTDWRLELQTYSFDGPRKRNFRTARRRMQAQNLKTVEAPIGEVDVSELTRVSEEWRKTRAVRTRELTFLIRPVVLADETDVRKFITLDAHGAPVAFTSFDPVFEAGRICGYLLATKRRLPTTDPLVGYDLVRVGVETFRAEGLKWMLLGLGPGDKIKDKHFKRDWTTSQCLHFIRESRAFHRFVYPIRGLIKHKKSFCGDYELSYCATNRWPGGLRFVRMARACGII